MFHIGDMVLYGTDGVCTITGIDEKDMEGDLIEYWILKPVYDEKSTLFVPRNNKTVLSKMRSVMSSEEIYELVHGIPQEDTIWIDDENERKQVYQNIIREGDRKKLVQLIKTLWLRKRSRQSAGRKLHQCDEVFLKQAEKLLHDEFAAVLHISPDEVAEFITQQIVPSIKKTDRI